MASRERSTETRKERSQLGEVLPFEGKPPERQYPTTAQGVIGKTIDLFAEKKVPVSGRARAMIGKQAKELLEDGFDFDTLVIASVMAVKRGEPHRMHWIASDLVVARAGEKMTRREYERALQDEMEIGGKA